MIPLIYTDKNGIEHSEYKYNKFLCSQCSSCKYLIDTSPKCKMFKDKIPDKMLVQRDEENINICPHFVEDDSTEYYHDDMEFDLENE